MGLALRGLAGSLKDKIFPIRADMTLGRSERSDIVLEGPKISSLHARIKQESEGLWRLEDNNSKNGTRVNGERVSSAVLNPGLMFQISDFLFEVIEVPDEAATPKKIHWYKILAEFLGKHADQVHDHAAPIVALNPALVLDFQRGVQVNSRWVIGYGPRNIGAASLDLPIWEPGAPPVCFEIFPSPDGLIFRTKHSDVVRVNGQKVDSHVLCVGDTIQILETILEVDFAQ